MTGIALRTEAALLTTDEVREAFWQQGSTAVLPVGSCEQHGPHLPLDTDAYLAQEVAREAVRRSNDLLLPTFAFGYNEKELMFPGTASLPARVFLDAIIGLGASLARSGWARLVLVNGHGWNHDLLKAAAHVLGERADFNVAVCSYWNLCLPEIEALRQSQVPGGMAHACEFETSIMLHLRPDSVRHERLQDEITYRSLPSSHHDLTSKSAISLPESFDKLSLSGVIGTPSLATAEKGRVWFEAAVGRLAEFLLDFRESFPRQTGQKE